MFDRRIRAFGPATVANCGAGFDVLGLSVEGIGDEVWVEARRDKRLVIAEIESDVSLPTDPSDNVVGIAAQWVLRRSEAAIGLTMGLRKGLGIGTGLGSSAASAAAAAWAVNALLDEPLTPQELIGAVLEAETHVSGAHADNAAAAIIGGVVMVTTVDPLVIHSLPIPSGAWLALITPDVVVNTKEARQVLPDVVTRDVAVTQAARLASMVHACHHDDLDGFAANALDGIAHDARIALIPCGPAALCAADHAGALGTFISGSGPTLAAVTRGRQAARNVVDAMAEEMDRGGIAWHAHISPISSVGARTI